MKNSKQDTADQDQYDPETGEINETEEKLFGAGEGLQPDGSTIIGKITGATIRAIPERIKLVDPPRPMKMFTVTGAVGGEYLMPPMDEESRLEALPLDNPERMTFTALVAFQYPWIAARFDDDGEPNAVFKSDYLFLPIHHNAVLKAFRNSPRGVLPIAFELWSQPSSNPRGYSWYLHDLEKYQGLNAENRLIKLAIQAGRQLSLAHKTTGLLANLRSTG